MVPQLQEILFLDKLIIPNDTSHIAGDPYMFVVTRTYMWQNPVRKFDQDQESRCEFDWKEFCSIRVFYS